MAKVFKNGCPECGRDMWDNREGKRNPKAPDFKCTDKNCEGVIWPPKDGSIPSGEIEPNQPSGIERLRQTLPRKAENQTFEPQKEDREDEETDNEWAPVARENMAKKALQIAADFCAKTQIDDPAKIFDYADNFYAWIESKRNRLEFLYDDIKF